MLRKAVPTAGARAQAPVRASPRSRARRARVAGAQGKTVGHPGSRRFVKFATMPGARLPFRDEAINRTW